MKLVTFGIDKGKILIVQFPVFIQPYTQQHTDIISNRDCASSHHRSEYAGTLLHPSTGKQTIHCIKLRNIHYDKAAGIKNIQKNRL